jgi:hypothetical protein
MRAQFIASPATSLFGAARGPVGTVCLLGLPRGGTSMLAWMVAQLGIFMGESIHPSTGEDAAFLSHEGDRAIFTEPAQAPRRAAFMTGLAATIAARNAAHDVWGWKDPLAPYYLTEIAGQLRQPRLIIVARDLAAIAQREALEEPWLDANALLGHALHANGQYRPGAALAAAAGELRAQPSRAGRARHRARRLFGREA